MASGGRRGAGTKIPRDKVTVTTSRSGGPGGQNVNKLNTKVTLRFDLDAADWLSEYQKGQLAVQEAGRLNKKGEFSVTSQRSRSQLENVKAAFDHLGQMCDRAAEVKKEASEEKLKRIEKLAKRSSNRNKERKKAHSDKKSGRRIDRRDY